MDYCRVAVDAMGGDNAPDQIIAGAVDALNHNENLMVVLCGKKEVIEEKLASFTYPADRMEIMPASEVIEMAESPVKAVTRKKDSSMVKGLMAVRRGECDAFVTAGSSGAALAGGQILVGRVKGIERAPFAPVLPTSGGPVLLVDGGANVDARPSQLVQFAQMGSIYMENVMGISNPRVGLVNIGAEEEKGNALVKETMPLLRELKNINFVGSIEARDIPFGAADVLVCDAFAGNVILKMYEGTASMLLREIKTVLKSSPVTMLGAALIQKPLKKTLKKFSTESYGGAPLLGLTGLVVKAHGNSGAVTIRNAIEQCIEWKDRKINDQFREKMNLVDRTASGRTDK